MQHAIQFTTHKTKERFIEIPKEFINDISGEFQVILILKEMPEPEKSISRKREFKALKVNTKEFKFNRDDIYEE
ncbi:MAG: hypothetical protein JO129_02265 [Candidatus Dependentiae bacterium]|nr:hypothetical protein [Candidatus Dependentiae bacterium]